MENDQHNIIDHITQGEYKYGFVTDIETETAPKGLNEDTIRYISAKKNEPDFLLDFRLAAYREWLKMKEP
ncbi:MAG: Fe-S cluster assembly protein SufB, partial [Bacteroidales bacterium]|nr:Fe-S cluster assembly protein SufB [Bacteroidales bacterium]